MSPRTTQSVQRPAKMVSAGYGAPPASEVPGVSHLVGVKAPELGSIDGLAEAGFAGAEECLGRDAEVSDGAV
jgi:hypothetical protein